MSTRIYGPDGFVTGRSAGEVVTPARRLVDEWRLRQHAFLQAVERALECSSVKLYRPIGPSSASGAVAVNEWDLRFKVAEQCPPELIDSYCSSLDGGQLVARFERLLEALRSSGRWAERVKSRAGAFFFVVAKELVHREPSDIVELASRWRT
jgi:hypothetical protein